MRSASPGRPTVQAPTSAPKAPLPNYTLPDLKKRVWIARPKLSATLPPEFNGVDVSGILMARFLEIFNHEKSPFVAEIAPGDLPEDPAEGARLARGAGFAGLLVPTLGSLEVTRRRAPEGLLQSSTVDLSVRVSSELIDGGSGKVLGTADETDASSQTRSELLSTEALPEPARRLEESARKLAIRTLGRYLPWAEKLGWSGKVVRLDGARVYIDSGRRTGLQVGDTLRVVEAPREIYDPQTGVFVGVAPGRLKATLKIIQLFGQDGAMSALQSGGGILLGDRVELY